MRRKRNNILPIVLIIIAVLAFSIVVYRNNLNKYKDMKYSVEHYITTGLFNKYKMYTIDKMDVSFSDGSLAVMSVTGLKDKAPHNNVTYKVFLEKSKSGIWKVKKIYTD